MTPVCPELNELLFAPVSDLEPANCFINKLRAMNSEEREQQLSKYNFVEQLKIARTHKICVMLNQPHNCILND
jgi:hypothetical protein